jgi:hypothetical protein
MKKYLCAKANFRGLIFLMSALLIILGGMADAADIGLCGNNSSSDVASLLTSNGHTVTEFGSSAPSSAQLAGLDVLIMLRFSGNTDIKNFVSNGGLLITEWNASEWALNTESLLDADDTGGGMIGTGTQITFTPAGATLGQGVSNPYSSGERTEYFRAFANIGSSVDILATRPGNIPAIIGGASGSGRVLIIGYDWADGFSASNADHEQLILNAVDYENQESPAKVPTLNEWGMIIMSLLLAGSAIWMIRRRQIA